MTNDDWFTKITTKGPTTKQIQFLVKLGHTGPMPTTLQEASRLIDELKAARDEARGYGRRLDNDWVEYDDFVGYDGIDW